MDSILKVLRERVECRTPIVVMREHTAEGTNEAAVALVMRIAAYSDAYVEHIHGARDDELAAIGKKIDNSIINGDWLVVSFGKQFSTMDFLRFVGRRLFTIMPDIERRPNMELFRLWLCLDNTVVLPQVFQKVAVHVNLLPLSISQRAEAEAERAACVTSSGASRPPTAASRPPTAASRPPTAPATKEHLAAAAASADEDDIPVDESTCDFEQAFDASPKAPTSERQSKAALGVHSSQVGALFYRRLELSAGKRPTSSGGRAAEIRKLRVQSAQLRDSSILKADRNASAHSARTVEPAVQPVGEGVHPPPRRPATASTGASGPTRPPTVHTTSPAQNSFDVASSEVLQKLHGSLIKAFAHSQPAAQRLLHVLLEFADSVAANPKSPSMPATTSVSLTALVPTHDCRHLDVGDVLRTEEGVTLRHGRWRCVEVLIEQMDSAQFATSWSSLARIRCFHKHPMISSPLAVLRDENASSLVYVVYTFPAMGPLVSVLRRMHASPVVSSARETSAAAITTTALRVARCCAIGLQLMHDEGYLHRDISSQQVFDFGGGVYQLRISNRCRARESDGGATAEGVAARWTSPDALFTGRYHPEDDIWSLGVLIWEILTRCQAIPYAECVLKDEVATALARGDILQPPEPFKMSPVWTKVAVPCFAMRLKRPELSELIAVMDKLLERAG